MLPWNEKCVSFQINPESASLDDIVRMAEELVEAKSSPWIWTQFKAPIKEAEEKKG